jgi:hypothetical protein
VTVYVGRSEVDDWAMGEEGLAVAQRTSDPPGCQPQPICGLQFGQDPVRAAK